LLAHYYSKMSNIVNVPFRSIWYSQHYKDEFNNNQKFIFLFFFKWHKIFDGGYIRYLRKKYPGCKCVLFLQDINNAKKLNMEAEKKRFDHIMVFEKNFALEHGIEYYPLVYSEGLKGVHYTYRPYDLTFVGYAKTRYSLVKEICDKITENKLVGCFYLSGFDDIPICDNPQIHFVKRIAYDDNIKLLKRSKCILDIVPSNTNCNTLRVSEAMYYKTKILTNNKHIVEEKYYNPEYISIYKDSSDIDIEFLKKKYVEVNYPYKEEISPVALLKHLEKVLNINDG